MTVAESIEVLADKLAGMETVSFAAAERLLKLLDKAPDEALQMIVDRKIKFCWMPANRRLQQRKAVGK